MYASFGALAGFVRVVPNYSFNATVTCRGGIPAPRAAR
jgi:hypothetical protein